MKQEHVWDEIARYWKDYREEPVEAVVEFLKGKKGRVLDLGCGTGRNCVKSKNVEFYGIDFSEKMLKIAKLKNYKKLVKSNVWEIAFPDDWFDYAIYLATLHCVEDKKDREKSLAELKGVLKKKGRALISVWDKNQPRFKNKNRDVFVNWGVEKNGKEIKVKRYYYLYDEADFLMLLRKYFKVIRVYSGEDRFSRRNIIVEVRKE